MVYVLDERKSPGLNKFTKEDDVVKFLHYILKGGHVNVSWIVTNQTFPGIVENSSLQPLGIVCS